MTNKDRLLRFIAEILIIYRIAVNVMPAVNFYSISLINIGTFILLYMLILFRLGVISFFIHSIRALLVFLVSVVGLFSLLLRGESVINGVYEFFMNCLWPLMAAYVLSFKDYKFAKRILMYVLLAFFITCVTTSIGCILFEGASRHMSNADYVEAYKLEVSFYESINIASFTFIYSLVLLVPFILYMIRYYRKGRLFSILLLLIVTVTVILTEYTTALLLFFVSFSLYLLPYSRKNSIHPIYYLLILIAVICIVVYLPIALESVSHLFGEQVEERLSSMADLLKGEGVSNESDLAQRMDFWKKSIDIFSSNILFGNSQNVGGHSYILDNLAMYGLLGLLAMVISFTETYRQYVRMASKNVLYAYMLMAFILNLIQGAVNPIINFTIITFVLPIFVFFYQDMERKYLS